MGVGTIAATLGAVWLAHWLAQRREGRAALDPGTSERAELRPLMVEAATALHEAAYAKGQAMAALMSHGPYIRERAPDVDPALTRAGRALDELRERLAVLLRPDHGAVVAFTAATGAFMDLYKPVTYLTRYGGGESHADFKIEYDEMKAAAERFDRHREEFVTAAAQTVGAKID